MNALRQYTDLYNAHCKDIDAHAPALLNELRPRAFEALQGKELPDTHTEGYERTSLDEMMTPDRGLNIMRLGHSFDLSTAIRCELPNVSTLQAYLVGDTFVPTEGLDRRLPEGVIFTSLARACEQWPDIIKPRLGTLADLNDVPTALNTLLCQDGAVVRIPAGTHLEKPLQIVNVFDGAEPQMAVRRLLVIVEKDASAMILTCDHSKSDTHSCLSLQVTEAWLDEGASLDICDMEETAASNARCSRLYVSQQTGSQLRANIVTLSCGTTRNDMRTDINGEHCRTEINGMAICTDRRHADNCSVVRHLQPRSHSRQIFKYVLDDYAQGAFEGSILVAPTAPYTEAYQSNRNVLASSTARMHTRPQLEIYNDEVSCSHGAATGQLDEQALFYMRTRGIPEREARMMLMQAFMSDVIDSVSIPGLADRLRHLTEMRFRGDTAVCGDCPAK